MAKKTNEIRTTWILEKPNKEPQRHEMICTKSKKTVCWPCWQRFCSPDWKLLNGGEHCYRCSSRKKVRKKLQGENS